MQHILQVNLEDSGGAFSLMFQVQKQLADKTIFDYFSMSSFKSEDVVEAIKKYGGQIYCAELRKNRLLGHLLLPFKFYKFLKKSDYAIIHIHADTAWKICLYAIPAKIIKTERVIIHSHSGGINGDYRKVKIFAHKIMKRFIPYVATEYCTCSRKATLWMYGDNPQYPVIWIKNGVDTDRFKFSESARKEIRKKLNIEDETLVIGTVGDLSYSKNPEYLIRIMRELKNATENKYKLIYIGSGNNDKSVRMYANEMEVVNDVIFYGKTDNVQKVLCALDIYVMPSRFEGLPVSVIEAQANGLPCILSSEITTEVGLSENTQFIRLAESIDNWVKSIQKMSQENRCRENGEILVRNHGFDIHQTAEMIYQIYNMTS